MLQRDKMTATWSGSLLITSQVVCYT